MFDRWKVFHNEQHHNLKVLVLLEQRTVSAATAALLIKTHTGRNSLQMKNTPLTVILGNCSQKPSWWKDATLSFSFLELFICSDMFPLELLRAGLKNGENAGKQGRRELEEPKQSEITTK